MERNFRMQDAMVSLIEERKTTSKLHSVRPTITSQYVPKAGICFLLLTDN